MFEVLFFVYSRDVELTCREEILCGGYKLMKLYEIREGQFGNMLFCLDMVWNVAECQSHFPIRM
jgi:hypothetical protein